MMPSLSVRKIEVETLNLLRQQAARHGVSMEEEVRTIIRQSVSTPERLGDLAVRLFSPVYGSDTLDIAPREVHEPLLFS
jgi:plasmid stability protein